MEHEIRLKTYTDYTIPEVVPQELRRQQAAIGVDLNQSAVDWAIGSLGGLPPGEAAYIVCADGNRETALALGRYFRLPVILLPPEIMLNPYSWALVAAKGTYFSTPSA